MPSRVITRPGSPVSSSSADGWYADRGSADSISRAITRAVASPIGWVRSQVVDRSITPSLCPVVGSSTGAAQHTQLCTIGA